VVVGAAREGAKVVVVGRDQAAVDEVVGEIAGEHGADVVLGVAADVSKTADVQRLVESTIQRFGRVDALITCAGVIAPANFLDITEEQWDWMMDVNLKGTFLCMQAVLPHMLKQGKGKIVTSTSLAGLRAVGGVDYAVSKAGVIALTQMVARELKPTGETRVMVNCVSPVAETRMSEALAAFRGITMEQFRANRPGRMLQPEDTVSTYLFFASDAADFVTGQVIAVDDGRSV
jgi:3-oxoacyl-[acyl-carrier protein] reductase